jgi:hypothetical protein
VQRASSSDTLYSSMVAESMLCPPRMISSFCPMPDRELFTHALLLAG